MGTKLQELRNGCFAAAMDDEPMFVLLARDLSAPDTVRQWADEREAEINAGRKPHEDRKKVDDARNCADNMEAWREENDGAWRNGLFARQQQLGDQVQHGLDENMPGSEANYANQ